jgi:hypothetical protein
MPALHCIRGDRLKKIFRARATCHTCMPYMILHHWRIRLYANYKQLRTSCDMPFLHCTHGHRLCRTCHMWFFLTDVREVVVTIWLSFTAFACSATCRLCSAHADRTRSETLSPTPPTQSVKEWLSTPFSCFYTALAYLIIYGFFFSQWSTGHSFQVPITLSFTRQFQCPMVKC